MAGRSVLTRMNMPDRVSESLYKTLLYPVVKEMFDLKDGITLRDKKVGFY